MAHETFGQYLLLKKLSEDALGEVFRAGRLREGNLEQVVLLRTLNGRALDAANLARAIGQRQAVQSLLRSPNLAQGLDAGNIQGVPYIAYDYISGRDLGSLMRQASLRSHPVPTEHALLVAERLALGLSVAHGTRVGGERILHGFLVPEFVMLSNEGENRLLGFEVGPSLRATDASSALWTNFGRYISPEAHSGSPLAATDDVYSLGVILLELLVGHSLENLGPSSLQGAIAQVAGRGLPNVAELIERSVAAQDQRIESAAAWHESLNRLALDRQSSSTPFHLAFYMHNLFREEIEQETEEIEYEKSIDFSKQHLGSSPMLATEPVLELDDDVVLKDTTDQEFAAAVAAPPATAGTSSETGSTATNNAVSGSPGTAKGSVAAQTATARAKPTSRTNKWLPIAAVAVLLLAVGGYFGWKQMNKAKAGSSTEVLSNTTTEAKPLGENELAPAEADLLASADQATDDNTTHLAGEGGPVVDARALAAGVQPDSVDPSAAQRGGDREQLMAELDQLVEERTKSAAQGIKQQYDDEVQRLKDQLAEVEQARQEEERLAREAEDARKKALADKQEKQAEAARQAEAENKRKAREAEAAKAAEAKKAADEAAARAPKKVHVGELVQPGPGVIRPRLSGQIRPVYPIARQRLRREADVSVEVLVDENGKVVDTRLSEKAGFGFDDAARTAASRAVFTPATTQGVNVKMWTTIKVQFRLDG